MSLIKMGLICYAESLEKDIDLIIEDMKNEGMLSSYAYILHDKDLLDNGDLKKPHYHVYLRFNVSTNQNSVAKRFGVSSNLVQKVSNVDGFLSYFVHAFDLEKFQYSINEVVEYNCSIIDSIDRCNVNDLKENRESEIIDFMVSSIVEKGFTLKKVLLWAIEYGYWDVFRKNYSILKDLALHII